MIKVSVELGERSYPILIKSNSLPDIGEAVKEQYQGKSIAVISDTHVAEIFGDTVMHSLEAAGFAPTLYPFPPGECSKSYDELIRLHTALLKSGMKRDGLIIALGGGITGDLAGFVASTYLRGIEFIQVPTTLLAQVDSSVGGKVGINHQLGKNLIGNFAQPQMVFIDPLTLKTLNQREIWAGLGEVIKYGLIWDSALFNRIEENLEDLSELKNLNDMGSIIGTCCQVKAAVVSKDEKEGGLRRILNFGHTVGHALEAATEYGYFKHGEAVVHGMRWAAWVSFNESLIDQKTFERIDALLKRFVVPDIPDICTADLLTEKCRLDKKQTQKGLNLVLLNDLGSTHIKAAQSMDKTIQEWLNYVKS